MNRSVMSSISLPRLEETTLDSTRFNQTVSLADITERPTESFQVSEDRATTEAYSLYHDFLHVFQENLDALSQFTTIESYATLTSDCGKMLKELSRQLTLAGRDVNEIRSLAENILQESSTWRLLAKIVQVQEEIEMIESMEDDSSNTMFSERYACEEIRRQNLEIRQIEGIVSWLEENAMDRCKHNYYSSNVSNENSLHNVKLGKLELDLNPDCPVKELHVLDRQQIQKLNSEIFNLIRAGRINEAITRCTDAGQCWKAAMMEGHVLYHNPEILAIDGEQEGTEERDLWKLGALAYSSSPNQSLYERASIGVLCGNTEPLLQIASNWEDRIWALLKGHLDVMMEELIRSYTIGENLDLPAFYWKQKQPIEALLQKANATTTGQDIFRRVQEYLIENDFGNLAEYLNSVEPETKHEGRFIAHLSIILQQLDIANASNTPIKLYANCVAMKANPDFNPRGDALIVAAYAQQLSQVDATECFANLLTQLSSMNEDNRNYFIQLAEKNGLDVFQITHQTVSTLQLSDNNETNAFDILLSNKKLEDSIELASKMIRNMIVAERDEDAKISVQKLINLGAMDIKNNENFILIKSHLEAIELFNEWSLIETQKPESVARPQISTSATFVQRIQLEKKWESQMTDEMRWQKELKNKALELKSKIITILSCDSEWFDKKAKSVCIPRLVISSLKALIGAEEYDECPQIINLLFSESRQLYKCLNTQSAPDILNLTAKASSKLLEKGKKL